MESSSIWWWVLGIVVVVYFGLLVLYALYHIKWLKVSTTVLPTPASMLDPWIGDIEQTTIQNNDFRRVLITGKKSQLVVMDVLPGTRVGPELHLETDQFIRVEDGQGTFAWRSSTDQPWKYAPIATNTAIFVPAGTWHEFHADRAESDKSTRGKSLKVYTLYAPPEHSPGTVQKTPPAAP